MTTQPCNETTAVVMEAPELLSLQRLALRDVEDGDVVVDVEFSGISTGTERLLWTGRMPNFPGMGYPLVPGYESVGNVVDAGAAARERIGDRVFVPGSTCFRDARGLFGGASRRLIVPQARAVSLSPTVRKNLADERGILLALAATAQHAIAGGMAPDLIVGHGVLGRLLARCTIASGAPAPTVWETNDARRDGATGYAVLHPEQDSKRDYKVICDASGDASLLDTLLSHLAKRGEIVLAGFYEAPISFGFPIAFMKEARLRVAAEWQPADLDATLAAIGDGRLSLDGLVTHRCNASDAEAAYRTAFGDAACLKMVLDWKGCA